MTLTRIRQLHHDLEKIAVKTPLALTEPGMMAIFNATLQKAISDHPDDEILTAIPPVDKNTRLGDLLVRVGAVKQALEDSDGGISLTSI